MLLDLCRFVLHGNCNNNCCSPSHIHLAHYFAFCSVDDCVVYIVHPALFEINFSSWFIRAVQFFNLSCAWAIKRKSVFEFSLNCTGFLINHLTGICSLCSHDGGARFCSSCAGFDKIQNCAGTTAGICSFIDSGFNAIYLLLGWHSHVLPEGKSKHSICLRQRS